MSKIILITHQKGGVGKSTLTFNLASNLKNNAKVAILDFDRQGSLAQIGSLAEGLTIITYEKPIEEIRQLDYDFIFIDTPPYLSEHLPKLIQIADLIVIPTKAGILDLLAIKSTIELISNENKKNNALIVFNMIKPNTNLTNEILSSMREYQVDIANTKISDLVVFTRSVLLNGVSSNSKAQQQIDNLTKEILTNLI